MFGFGNKRGLSHHNEMAEKPDKVLLPDWNALSEKWEEGDVYMNLRFSGQAGRGVPCDRQQSVQQWGHCFGWSPEAGCPPGEGAVSATLSIPWGLEAPAGDLPSARRSPLLTPWLISVGTWLLVKKQLEQMNKVHEGTPQTCFEAWGSKTGFV